MVNVEEIVANEKLYGWYWHLFSRPDGWECQGNCGVDVLAHNLPRPIARGSSILIALTLAIRDRNKKYGKPTKRVMPVAAGAM